MPVRIFGLFPMSEVTPDTYSNNNDAKAQPLAKRRPYINLVISALGVIGSSCLGIAYKWSDIKIFICDISYQIVCFLPKTSGEPKKLIAECDSMTSAGWDTFRANKSIKISFDRIDHWPAIEKCKQALKTASDDKTEANQIIIGQILFQIGRAYDKAAKK